jgi:outer membrane receptor protein involved in Fe transport
VQHGLCCFACAVLILAGSAKVSATERMFELHIPAGEAQDTLRSFVETTNMPMLYLQSDVEGVPTPGVSGTRTARDALVALLEGTSLEAKFKSGNRAVHVGQRTVAVASDGPPPLSLVVVTGSHLRDVDDIVSPLIVRGSKYIRRAAYATTQEALQSMPSVSRAGPSEVFDTGGNFGRGSSVNLRGLGAGATLTLFNGHRLAPSGASADFVDVSTIPVSVIDHIDVLLDGSSALYGSDPIAGIVNIIPRVDLQGWETQTRVGESSGGGTETLFAQLLGAKWATGNSLFAYQYWQRTALPVFARSYARNADKQPRGSDLSSFSGNPGNLFDLATGQPAFGIPRGQNGRALTDADLTTTLNRQNSVADTDLLPDAKMHSLYGSLSQRFGRMSLTGELRFNQRDISQRYPAVEAILVVPRGNPFFIDTKNPVDGTENPVNVVGYSFAKDFGPIVANGRTQNYGGALTVSADLARSWTASFTHAYDRVDLDWTGANQVDFDHLSDALARTDSGAFNPYGDGSYTYPSTLALIRESARERVQSHVQTQTLLLQGVLANMPTGEADIAAGVERRSEQLVRPEQLLEEEQLTRVGRARVTASRDVQSAFAELTLPVWGSASRPRAQPKVNLKLAGRVDH